MFRMKTILWTLAALVLAGLCIFKPEPARTTPSMPPYISKTTSLSLCSQAAGNSMEYFSPSEYARAIKLLRTHPSEEIRVDLLPKILNGDLCLRRRIMGTDDAQFTSFVRPFGKVPFIFLRSHFLKPDNERIAQLVIYHEYVHYRQWREDRIDADADKEKMGIPSDCKKIWHAEMEAYQKECELAHELGWGKEIASLLDCSDITHHVINAHGRSTHCSEIWQELFSE